jgi:hypothetical protein
LNYNFDPKKRRGEAVKKKSRESCQFGGEEVNPVTLKRNIGGE